MKKHYFILLLSCIFCISLAAQNVISIDRSISLDGTEFKNANVLYKLSDKDELLAFVKEKVLNDNRLRNEVSLTPFRNNNLDTSAIIVLRHDLTKYEIDTTTREVMIEEGEEIVHTTLHQEKSKYSDYLLATKSILLIFIGGDKDLQKSDISIKHNKKALVQSFDDLKQLAALNTKSDASGTIVKIRVVLLSSKEIIPPSDIFIKHKSFKEDLKFVVHEKVPAQFKAGVSFSYIDQKFFKIQNNQLQNNQLTVSPDSTGKANWKANLVATFDWYPFGRDIDRLDEFWKKGSIPFEQRFGIYGGLQISKDPLQGIYYGFSFAALKNMTLNFGAVSLLDPEEQTVNVGSFTSLDDAKQLLKRKYNTKFFIGLTFSPTDIKSILFPDNKTEKK